MFTQVKRIIKYGLKIFSRDGEIALVEIFILTITVLLISSLFLFRQTTQHFLSYLKEKADISIYFKEDVPEEKIFEVQDEILKIAEVKVDYVSKEKALEEFQKRHQKNPILIEALKEIGENPFLASLSIKAKDVGKYEEIISFLENQKKDLIEKIDYFERKPILERIFFLSSKIEKGLIIISAILVLISILVVFNTVRLSIINFGEEISIQRLVGASNWFIRGPFLVRGLICGSLSAIFSFLILLSVCWFFGSKLTFFLENFNIFQIFSEKILIFLSINIFCGIFLATISNLIAIRRYLKI